LRNGKRPYRLGEGSLKGPWISPLSSGKFTIVYKDSDDEWPPLA
jgi:hypothetical protein